MALGLVGALAACRASPATARDDAAADVVVDDRSSPRDLAAQDDRAPDATMDAADPAGDDAAMDALAQDRGAIADAVPASDAPGDDAMLDVARDVAVDVVVTTVDVPPIDASGPPPVYATTDVLVDKVFASFDLTFVVSRDGRLWGWGENSDGQLSPSDVALPIIRGYRVRPQRIEGVDSVLEWAGLFGFGECVLSGSRGSASVYCWGRSAYGTWGRGYGDSWDDWRFPHPMGTVSDVLRFASSEVIRSDLSAWRPSSRDAGWRNRSRGCTMRLAFMSVGGPIGVS